MDSKLMGYMVIFGIGVICFLLAIVLINQDSMNNKTNVLIEKDFNVSLALGNYLTQNLQGLEMMNYLQSKNCFKATDSNKIIRMDCELLVSDVEKIMGAN